MQARDLSGELALVLECGNPLEFWFEGLQALGFNRRFVEAGRIEVAELATIFGVCALPCGSIVEDRSQDLTGMIVELTEEPPHCMVGRNWVRLQPRAASVLVEVGAWLDAGVDGRRVEHRGQRLLGLLRRLCPHRQGCGRRA